MNSCGNWQKYQSKNPVQRWLIERFLKTVAGMVSSLSFSTVLDAGSGEGFVGQHLLSVRPAASIVGVDVDGAALDRGRRLHPQIVFEHGNVCNLAFDDGSFDLVICNEVLEHLIDPARALKELSRVSRQYCLLSVPHEPFFCLMNLARGKNIARLGSDADHHHLWTARQFRNLVSQHMELLDSRYPLPWQVYLAKIKFNEQYHIGSKSDDNQQS